MITAGIASPFAAAFWTPLDVDTGVRLTQPEPTVGKWLLVGAFGAFNALLVTLLLGLMIWLFNSSWRVSGGAS